MKKFIFILFLPLYLNSAESSHKFGVEYLEGQRENKALKEITRAIIWVESRGNDFAIGLNQDRGCAQITPILLKDYNLRTGSHYTGNDLFKRSVSIEIFTYYARMWGVYDYEKVARNWNGGPNGYKREVTNNYWLKIKAVL